MLGVLRSLLISVISASLICSPLFLSNSNASNKRPSQQDRNPPPQELADHQPGILLIKFIPEAPKQARDTIIHSVSKSHQWLRGQSGIVKLTLKDNLDFNATFDALSRFDGVIESVQPNYFVKRASAGPTSGLPKTPKTRHTKDRPTPTNLPTVIALIDTGIDIHHRGLKGALWLNGSEKSGLSGSDDDRNGFTDDTRGWNFINDSNDVIDDNGHGTQVAGIIAQSGAALSILPLKALDHTGTGTVADVVEAMDYAVARHAAVINCSFGAPAYSRAMLEAIQRAEAAGIVVVAAAGNNGKDLSKSSFYPASYHLPNLISVAATDENNLLAAFSNYSADIAALGTNIATAHRDHAYVHLTGTSAAAGFVSAAAGLLKSKRGWVSAQTIRDAILKSANQSFDLKDKVSSKGTLNPAGALSLLLRSDKSGNNAEPTPSKRMTPVIKAALQSGNGNLDTMRSSQPQAPNPYQQTGTLPPAGYDDPKPADTANYDSYLTQLARDVNDTGVAGSKPLQTADPTAGATSIGGWSYNLGSRNYNFTLPVLGLPGRAGLGVSLGLSYNSKLWIHDPAANTYVFNPDRGFPAPGWRIGFGLIQVKNNTQGAYLNGTTGKNSIIYIAPDGTRHDLAFNSATNRYESYDSSYIAFDANQQTLYFPDGTKAQYGANSYDPNVRDFQQYPVEIKDRNGNFITITYKTLSTQKVVIDYVTDTAGRRIDFNYQNNKLVSVSQNRNGSVFKYVSIDYQPVTIQTNFPGGAAADPGTINNSQVYFPSRITYPTGINYRFGYTSYGQINSIQRWVPTISGQGDERVVAYTNVSLESYNPNNPIFYSPDFIFRTEWAENWQGGSVQSYRYNYDGPYGHEITDPTIRTFRVWRNGMTMRNEIIDSGKVDEMTYTSDAGLSYLSNPRVTQAKATATLPSDISVRITNYSYLQRDGMWLVQHKDDVNGVTNTLYRRTTTSYTSYPGQYILGLPEQVSIHNASGVLLSRATNHYDETGTFTDSNGQTANYFIDASGDGVIQHNTGYGASFTERGNPTSVVQSSVVNGSVNSSRTVKRISYDTNGNVRAETDAAGNRKQVLYIDNYSNKPGSVGQTHVQVYTAADPTGFRAGSQWNYYTGQTIKTFNLTPGSTTETQVVTTSYDFADRPLVTTRPNGGWMRTDYWDNWLTGVTSQLVETGKVSFKYDQVDGAGRGYRKASDHPDGVAGKYSGQIIVFDKAGRSEDTSNVIAITGTWAPTAEDSSTGFLFTHLTRDELSRLKIVTFPDNNSRQFDYTGCGCAGTSETRVTDEIGHYTITKTDFLGRLVEAIEPIGLDNSTYSKASYFYDELDRLLTINHSSAYNSTTGQTPTQSRYFSFDGYGRLQSENTPEGGIVNYTYTANDLVLTAANQRNITVTNSYNTRNLLTGVSYSDGTPSASFGYDAFGARNSMTDGEGQTTYSYNSFRQLRSETRTFIGLLNNTYTLNYTYNLADQIKSVNYLINTGGSGGGPFTQTDSSGGSQEAYNISGTVRDQQNQPVSGATITLSGSQSGQTTTNSQGQYSFPNLPTGGNYTLTPSKSGFNFSPSNRTYNNLNSNKTDADFTAIPVFQTLFNKNVNYAYNIVGAFSGVGTNIIGSDPNATTNVLNTLTFRGSGAIKSLNYGNGRRLQMDYNANRQQPTSMKVDMTSNPNDKIIDYTYEYYDANGKNNNRIRKITDNIDSAYTTDYTYDDYNRLTIASAPAYTRSYLYDQWGNIKNFSGVTLDYATNTSGAPATNRLASDSTGFNYSFDAAGNQTSAPGYAYEYDGANRLKQVNSGAATYGYDGDGMKARQTSSGNSIFYVRSSVLKAVVIEANAAGIYRAYVYAGDKLIAQQSYDGQFYWMHTDHLGSGHKMTDSTGVVKYRSEFDPYGQTVMSWAASGDTSINSRRFTGYERDVASGLDYANARMYNNGRGRFIQPDPVGTKSSDLKDPQSLNLYAYVKNDPVNLIDPTGRGWIDWITGPNNWLCRHGLSIFCNVFQPRAPNPETGGLSALGELPPLVRIAKPILTRSVMIRPTAFDKCGSAYYQVEWRIKNGGLGVDGWVIQHHIRAITVHDKNLNIIPPSGGARSVEYWEAWEVKDGYVYTGDEPIGLDRWQTSDQGTGTGGTWQLVGFAKFIPKGEGIDPSTWGRKVREARDLYSTYSEPANWSDRGALVHDMEVIWDCTGSEPKPPIVR